MIRGGLIIDENISNLTCASGEVSASSSATLYSQQSFASTNQAPPPPLKKKRSLPGNPDPDSEVIALSPKTLLATNRFICEICNKGFQRDQNLQLHRRGHNLPWKLKKKESKEVRKKVYVCPEATCVHRNPSRALGDLTGIKKHFCRKHGEKKWKCEKCSKRYAVQSDWKAHSKICGTKEYRCDCGTLFSRRDSFITHRAFCDALAEESVRAITLNPILSSHQQPPITTSASHMINLQALTVKREQESHNLFNPRQENNNSVPPLWLWEGPQLFESQMDHFLHQDHQNPSINPNLPLPPNFQQLTTASSSSSAHTSAIALLQKAAQMGVTTSKPSPSFASFSGFFRPHQAYHMSETTTGFSSTSVATSTAGSAQDLSSREGIGNGFGSFGNKVAPLTSAIIGAPPPPPPLVHDMVSSLSSATRFDDEDFNGFLNPKKDHIFHETLSKSTDYHFSRSDHREGRATTAGGRGNDGLTRDFLGLKAFSPMDFLNIAGLGQINSSSTYGHHNQSQSPWQG